MSKHTATSLKKVRPNPAAHLAELAFELPPGSILTAYDVSWEDYDRLMELIVDVTSLRISYDEGVLQIMSVSARHESYTKVLERMVMLIGFILRIKILFYGSATMRKKRKHKGNEPDACFYVQSADLLPNKLDIDFEQDPPPDIAVEIDVHHASGGKLPIYAALGVPEVWHYDQNKLTIFQLQGRRYIAVESSPALPFLSSQKLTEFLNRSRNEDQHEVLLAFEKWLKSLKKRGKK